jgi:transcriptional regulator with XRE-family HTH domain
MGAEIKPIYGYLQYPHMGDCFVNNPHMDIAAIISANLRDWMAETPALDTFKKLSAKSGVGFGTVQRAKNGDGNITVEKLEAIAAVFGRTAAELVTPSAGSQGKSTASVYADSALGTQAPKAHELRQDDAYREEVVELRAKTLAQQASEVAGLWMDLQPEQRQTLLDQLRRDAGVEQSTGLAGKRAPQRRPGRPSKKPQAKPDYPSSSG